MFKKPLIVNMIAYILVSCVAVSAVAMDMPGSFDPSLPVLSDVYDLPFVRGVKYDPSNPFDLRFIVDIAGGAGGRNISPDALPSEEEQKKLVRFFLAGLTVPEEKLWVNLSPYESDRIVEDSVAVTEVGRVMLEQDYLLKQVAGSLTHPDTPTGKKYWSTLTPYTLNLTPVQGTAGDLSKIWISPESLSIYDSNNTVFINEAKLKVESDAGAHCHAPILAALKSDVNSGKDFAPLRQMTYSLILAQWFKRRFAESLYKYYYNAEKTAGIDNVDPAVKQQVFEKYAAAFNQGAYDITKKERNAQNHLVKRRYFSGGYHCDIFDQSSSITTFDNTAELPLNDIFFDMTVSVETVSAGSSSALLNGPRAISGTQVSYMSSYSELIDDAVKVAGDSERLKVERKTIHRIFANGIVFFAALSLVVLSYPVDSGALFMSLKIGFFALFSILSILNINSKKTEELRAVNKKTGNLQKKLLKELQGPQEVFTAVDDFMTGLNILKDFAANDFNGDNKESGQRLNALIERAESLGRRVVNIIDPFDRDQQAGVFKSALDKLAHFSANDTAGIRQHIVYLFFQIRMLRKQTENTAIDRAMRAYEILNAEIEKISGNHPEHKNASSVISAFARRKNVSSSLSGNGFSGMIQALFGRGPKPRQPDADSRETQDAAQIYALKPLRTELSVTAQYIIQTDGQVREYRDSFIASLENIREKLHSIYENNIRHMKEIARNNLELSLADFDRKMNNLHSNSVNKADVSILKYLKEITDLLYQYADAVTGNVKKEIQPISSAVGDVGGVKLDGFFDGVDVSLSSSRKVMSDIAVFKNAAGLTFKLACPGQVKLLSEIIPL